MTKQQIQILADRLAQVMGWSLKESNHEDERLQELADFRWARRNPG